MDEFKDFLYRLGLSVADLVILLVRLRASAIWQGRLVEVVLPASKTSVTVAHGLLQAHRGGFVVAASHPVPAFVRVATSERELTLIVATSSIFAVSYRLWVF